MEFTSLTFLFLFFPLLVVIYLLAQVQYRPMILLAASIVFLAWDRSSILIVYLFLTGGNFLLARWLEKAHSGGWRLAIGVTFNLFILLFHKYFSTYQPVWLTQNFELVLPDFFEKYLLELVYPIGLSYVALQMISYLVDVARKTIPSEKNLINFTLYVTFFPKIPTGPIALLRSIRTNLTVLESDSLRVANGLRRFALGLIKKVLVADQLAKISNPAFGLPSPNFPPYLAWLSLIAFTLQIYYDFSGYTDMAIGLGRIFGISLPENFNQPFSASSIGEFWRRWHMSLTSWFREYVFFPLERRRLQVVGQQLNIILVFILTGLWHGLTWNFLVWGLIHGFVMALESTSFGILLKKIWRPVQTIYMIGILAFSWIFFRSPTLAFAWAFIKRLAGDSTGITPVPFSLTSPLPLIDPTTWIALGAAIFFVLPLRSISAVLLEKIKITFSGDNLFMKPLSDIILLILFWAGIAIRVGGDFMPGIYDKF